MGTQTNPRIIPLTQPTDIVSPEQIHIVIQEPQQRPPPIVNRIARQAAYYTVAALIEPQEPRYSAVCVIFSLFAAFGAGLMMRKCS
jgi:hypothetical protein